MRTAAMAAVVLLLCTMTTGPGTASASCALPILPLADATRQAPTAIIADVIREQADETGGYTSTLRVVGLIKGRATGQAITIAGLGHAEDDCLAGLRLTRGNRYVLLLTHSGPDSAPVWALSDGPGSVYQLGTAGVQFPPERAGGQPQSVQISAADFVRNVGIITGADHARIEDLIGQLGLSETTEAVAAPATADRSFLSHLSRLPRRETSLVVAATAVLVASLLFLLWPSTGANFSRRP